MFRDHNVPYEVGDKARGLHRNGRRGASP